MPFEKGNKLGAKGRQFDGALRRAIAQDDGKRLREAAEQLLTKASEGEPWAIGMLADRLDGKAPQSVTVESKSLQEMSLGEFLGALESSIAGGGQEAFSSAEPASGVH